MSINRRQILFAGAAVPVMGFLPMEKLLADTCKPIGVGPVYPLSPSVVNSATNTLVGIVAKIHQNTVTREDMQTAASTVTMIGNYFKEINFDASFQKAVSGIKASQITQASLNNTMNAVYQQLHKVDPTFMQSDVFKALNLQEPKIADGLSSLRCTVPSQQLIDLAPQIADIAQKIPAKYVDGAKMLDVLSDNSCWYMGTALAFLGNGLGVLGIGCFVPEPFFEVICGALGVWGAVTGIVGYIWMTVCL